MREPGIARQGYQVLLDGRPAGIVTSGTQTPYLKKAIGLAYVPPSLTAPGSEFEVDIRGRRIRAAVVPLPFYKRPR
jgi:aminomethyltransferase